MSDAQDVKKPAASGGMKKIVVMLVAAVLIGGGGAGAWWMLGRDKGDASPKAKAAPVIPPVFLPLEAFTVNLRPEPGGNQHYIQVGITLKIAGEPMAEKIKGLMPEIRNHLLLLLSAKTAAELLRPEGKTTLAKDLLTAVARIVEPASLVKPEKTPVKVAAAPSPTQTDASENNPAEDNTPAEGEPAEAAEAPPPPPAPPPNPVLAVLFTSFIIQ